MGKYIILQMKYSKKSLNSEYLALINLKVTNYILIFNRKQIYNITSQTLGDIVTSN